jgi:hypothetical protein
LAKKKIKERKKKTCIWLTVPLVCLHPPVSLGSFSLSPQERQRWGSFNVLCFSTIYICFRLSLILFIFYLANFDSLNLQFNEKKSPMKKSVTQKKKKKKKKKKRKNKKEIKTENSLPTLKKFFFDCTFLLKIVPLLCGSIFGEK